MRDHRGGSGLAVGAGYSDGQFIIFHDLSQKFGSGEHRQPHVFRLLKFRIVRVDGSSVYHQLDIVGNIGGPLADIDSGTFGFQLLCQIRSFGVRTGDDKVFLQKDLGQSAHTDAADPDKMNVHRFMKINLIHDEESLPF